MGSKGSKETDIMKNSYVPLKVETRFFPEDFYVLERVVDEQVVGGDEVVQFLLQLVNPHELEDENGCHESQDGDKYPHISIIFFINIRLFQKIWVVLEKILHLLQDVLGTPVGHEVNLSPVPQIVPFYYVYLQARVHGLHHLP